MKIACPLFLSLSGPQQVKNQSMPKLVDYFFLKRNPPKHTWEITHAQMIFLVNNTCMSSLRVLYIHIYIIYSTHTHTYIYIYIYVYTIIYMCDYLCAYLYQSYYIMNCNTNHLFPSYRAQRPSDSRCHWQSGPTREPPRRPDENAAMSHGQSMENAPCLNTQHT